jgi:hypothetical protein
VSEAVDKHIAKAFASLDDLSKRELEATADLLGHRRHPLYDFASAFRQAAYSRESGDNPWLGRSHLRQSVERADHDLMARLEEAEAPFWRHVRRRSWRADKKWKAADNGRPALAEGRRRATQGAGVE